jgi:hypothetical protein
MPNIEDAILALQPKAEFTVCDGIYSGIGWLSPDIPKPTEDEINAKLQELAHQEILNACKLTAKALLVASDWSVLPDVGLKNSADFVTYRGILRGLATQPVTNPDWPVEPTPVWE